MPCLTPLSISKKSHYVVFTTYILGFPMSIRRRPPSFTPPPPFTIEVLIEIPAGHRARYSFDRQRMILRYDQPLSRPAPFPADYGFMPKTVTATGGPQLAFVLPSLLGFTGMLVTTSPICALVLENENTRDHLVLCAPTDSPVDSLGMPLLSLLGEIEQLCLSDRLGKTNNDEDRRLDRTG